MNNTISSRSTANGQFPTITREILQARLREMYKELFEKGEPKTVPMLVVKGALE